MKARTEELLYLMLWTADTLMQPTWRNTTDSFEAWAYRNGYMQQIQRLELRKCLELRRGALDKRLIRLTEHGRTLALGGRDPVARWGRDWDGKWRLVIFDLPSEREAGRSRLRRFFLSHGFGNLQRSVWVTPDEISTFRKTFRGDNQVKTFACFESVLCGGERDVDVVMGAWDWPNINALYAAHRAVLEEFPGKEHLENDVEWREKLLEWGRKERCAWKDAVTVDPLLPSELLPRGYAGKKAWKRRVGALARAGQAILSHQ